MTRFIIKTSVLFILLTGSAFSQTTESTSLSSVLNADGTIKENINGSFDASGFEMRLEPSGEPVFVPGGKPNSTSSVIEWGKFYTGDGVKGTFTSSTQPIVYAIAIDGNNVYLGGRFTSVGGIKCNYIAKWDGSTWSSLGTGLGDIVYTIIVGGGTVYAGGSFSVAGGVQALRVAKWDGTNWSAIGSGFDNTVRTLAFYKGYLHAAGHFTLSGTTSVNMIAKWNGTSWEALSVGLAPANRVALSVVASADTLYVGGTFTIAGGVSTGYIAKWDGSSWYAVGSGFNSSINALYYFNGSLYAGGGFTSPASYIAQWNGTAWSALGTGVNASVNSIMSDGTNIYAAGSFSTAGGVSANRIAKWNGSNWSSLYTGLTGITNSMAWDGTQLLVGGDFSYYFRTWNGSRFSSTDHNFDIASPEVVVQAICLIGSDVYIAGKFTSVGGVTANNIAKWNGTVWSQLGSGANGAVYALATDGTNLYAGGYFTSLGLIATKNIGMWNGTSWNALGGGVAGYVYELLFSNGSLFVGGAFHTVDNTNVPAEMIARWDGSSWYSLGTGLSSSVYSMALSGTDIYAGGEFTTAGGISANRIAKWNGTGWSALGTGLSAAPAAIAISGTNLYVGGSFYTAGGVVVNSVARWDMTGGTWNAMGTGTNGNVACLTIEGGDLYIGGNFTEAGGGATPYIAKWDGTSWSSLGTGLDGTVYAIVPSWHYQGFLVGGSFISYSTTGIAKRVAKLTDSDNPLPVELVSFSGRLSDKAIQLNWQTATEIDNNGFAIERKNNNSNWQQIAFIGGHGTSNSPKYYSFTDETVTVGTKYAYRLKQIDGDGTFTYSNMIEIATSAITDFFLEQNYPNPFNPETVIRFALPARGSAIAGDIKLEVFNSLGERIATLVEGFRESGVYSVGFNGTDFPSGVYFYKLSAGDRTITRKMMMIR